MWWFVWNWLFLSVFFALVVFVQVYYIVSAVLVA